MRLSSSEIEKFKAALREDLGLGDLTSRLLIPQKALGHAFITAKQSGVFCGEFVAREIFKAADSKIRPRFLVRDGQSFPKGSTLIQLEGPVRSILAGERTALNFLGHLCGIATRTRDFVSRVKGTSVRILDTRKTTPLWRALEKYAVKCGGGTNHRMGLYDAVFVKENHRRFGDLEKLKKIPRNFEIEVRSLKELEEALALKPRVILFDNFTPAALKRAAALARKRDPQVILEASGGVTLENVRAFARTGVDQISSGALTHSVKALDLSLLIQ
jgi:nicotinate-nucleotide pyrophosphorylase (carboxylating)